MAKIINSNREFLKTFDLQGREQKRFLHLATIHEGVREFVCLADTITTQLYINEVIGSQFETIEDESLFESLRNLLFEADILNMSKPLLSDEDWFRRNET